MQRSGWICNRSSGSSTRRFLAGCFAHGTSDEGGRDEFDESGSSRCSSSAIRRSRCSNAVSKSRTRASNCSTTASNAPGPATPRSSQASHNPPTPTANQLNSYLQRFGDLVMAGAVEAGEVGQGPRHSQGAHTAAPRQRADLQCSVQWRGYRARQPELGVGEGVGGYVCVGAPPVCCPVLGGT